MGTLLCQASPVGDTSNNSRSNARRSDRAISTKPSSFDVGIPSSVPVSTRNGGREKGFHGRYHSVKGGAMPSVGDKDVFGKQLVTVRFDRTLEPDRDFRRFAWPRHSQGSSRPSWPLSPARPCRELSRPR